MKILIYISLFFILVNSKGFLYSQNTLDSNLIRIYKQLDNCLDDSITYQIKYLNENEFVKYRLSSNEINLDWRDYNYFKHCFRNIDTLIHIDTVYTNYFSDLLDFMDSDILKAIDRGYHRYLNNKPYDFTKEIDLLRELKRIYDSTTFAWETADTINGIYIPKDLNDALNQLDTLFSSESINKFKSYKEEDDAAGIEHLSKGMELRNQWKISGSRLGIFFNKYGIYNSDRMSDIIIRACYRKLNNKPINFEELIQMNLKYEEEERIQELEDKNRYKKK